MTDSDADASPVTVARLWAETTAVLGDRVQARWLCEVACALDAEEFIAAGPEPVTERMVAHLDAMVARVRTGEPLAYVCGRWAFRHLDVTVDPRVLIPRPETELVAEQALWLARARHSAHGSVTVIDLGTGSGVIGLSLAQELPVDGTTVWCTDADAAALDVARANLAGLGRAGRNVRMAQGSWWGAVPTDLLADVAVSNPPYIAENDERVEESVRRWEPPQALFAGADGLDAYRDLIAGAPSHLRPGGALVLEIGHTQGPAVRALLSGRSWGEVQVLPDLAGRDRIVVAYRSDNVGESEHDPMGDR